jgi:hypothetical protein
VEEVVINHTSEFDNDDYCKKGFKELYKKPYKWVDKKNTNVITKINEFRCKVKDIIKFSVFKFFYSEWGRYRKCETYIQKFAEYLVDKYPNQIGVEIYKSFESNR